MLFRSDLFPGFPRPVSCDRCCNDQLTWVFQIALLQIAARPIHHDAVMLLETLCWLHRRPAPSPAWDGSGTAHKVRKHTLEAVHATGINIAAVAKDLNLHLKGGACGRRRSARRLGRCDSRASACEVNIVVPPVMSASCSPQETRFDAPPFTDVMDTC